MEIIIHPYKETKVAVKGSKTLLCSNLTDCKLYPHQQKQILYIGKLGKNHNSGTTMVLELILNTKVVKGQICR